MAWSDTGAEMRSASGSGDKWHENAAAFFLHGVKQNLVLPWLNVWLNLGKHFTRTTPPTHAALKMFAHSALFLHTLTST